MKIADEFEKLRALLSPDINLLKEQILHAVNAYENKTGDRILDVSIDGIDVTTADGTKRVRNSISVRTDLRNPYWK